LNTSERNSVRGNVRTVPTGKAGVLYQVLTDLTAGPDSAIIPPHPDVPPDMRGVLIKRARQMFNERTPDPPGDAQRMVFNRAFTKLLQDRKIGAKDPWVWVV